jgi:hypothetical protein
MDTNQDYILQDTSLDPKSGDNFNHNPFSIAFDTRICRQMDKHDLPIMRSCCALHEEKLPLAPVPTFPARACDVTVGLSLSPLYDVLYASVVVFGREGVWLFLARKESCDVVTVKSVSSKHGLRRLDV